MSEKIIEALRKLDQNNEDHWTTEGLPRLDVLKELTGEVVSRVDVTNAARGFSRSTMEVLNPVANTAPVVNEAAVEPVVGITDSLQTASTNLQRTDVETDAEYADFLREKHAALEVAVQESGKKATEAQAEFQSLQKQLNQIATELSNVLKVNESANFSETIKAYQESQQAQRQAQADKARALNAALELVAQGKVS